MSKFSEKRIIDDIRLLSLDMINKAGSGHPGIALGAAPILYSVFANHLEFDLEKKDHPNRDRFVMSAGHGSALLYATLYALCEDYTIEDLMNFRRINSCTPGSPELDINHRIEVTTGALGEGFATAVGLAIAEKHLEDKYNTKKITLFDYDVYCFCSDGDLMEGISYEAAAIAGENNLDNLIVLYDANNVTLDGSLDKDYTDKIIDMYVALGWDVLVVKNGEKVSEIDRAIEMAKRSGLPSLVVVNTTIGKYSEYENTNKIHGKLEESDLNQIREKLQGKGPFLLDEENLAAARKNVRTRTQKTYEDWYETYKKYLALLPQGEDSSKLDDYLNNADISLKLDKIIDVEKLYLDKPMREINYQIMNVIGTVVDTFIGGSADLRESTKTYLKNGGNFGPKNYKGRNIQFGVRENAMGAILNGLALTNFRPFGSTFLAFSDFLRPSLRNSALMKLPVTYIFTHDSITVGGDGITHEPIEQLGSLRMIPNLDVYRPCDYKELIGAWNLILKNRRPSALIVSKEPTDTYKFTSSEEIAYGGYVISEVKTRLDVILIASGSEVTLAMEVKRELLKNFIEARVVSMPNINEFLRQSKEYQNQVLPRGYKRMVIEFSNDPSLYRLVKSEEDVININRFGKSGTKEEILSEFELDIPSIIIKIKNNI